MEHPNAWANLLDMDDWDDLARIVIDPKYENMPAVLAHDVVKEYLRRALRHPDGERTISGPALLAWAREEDTTP